MATAPQTFPTKQSDPFGTVLSNSFRLIRQSWQALLINLNTILLVYILPSVLVFALLYVISPQLITGDYTEFPEISTEPLAIVAAAGILILLLFLSIASIIVQLASARRQKISFSDVIEQSSPFVFRFIGLGFLTMVAILFSAIFFIIPALFTAFFLSFAAYVMVDKNLGPVAAMKGSFHIVKANWKLVLSYFIVTLAISLPQIVPILGAVASALLSIAYFCLPAILYLRMGKPAPKAPTAPGA